MLVNLNDVLIDARKNQYAVGLFNTTDTDMLEAAIAAAEEMRGAVERLGFSARAYDRVLRVARTAADLEGREDVGLEHVMEAVGYRQLENQSAFWA
jgi:predicted ATPase with chaperone activity